MTASTQYSPEILPPTMAQVRRTTGATTDNYTCPFFSTIEAVIANNESDNDGVGVKVSGAVITLTVGNAGDVVTLMIVGLP